VHPRDLALGRRLEDHPATAGPLVGGVPKPLRASWLIDGSARPTYGTWILPVRVSEHLVPLYAPPGPLNSSSHWSMAVPPPAAPS
jgi:hypothetical protein